MTTPDTEPREAAFFSTIRSWGIVRGPEGLLGGVISAVGKRVGLAPWPARLIYILIAIFAFPFALLAYAAGWALLPDAQGNIVVQNFGRGVMNVGALIGIAIIGLVGFFSLNDAGPFWFSINAPDAGPLAGASLGALAILFGLMVPLLFAVGITLLIVWLIRRSNSGTPEERAAAIAAAEVQAAAATADANVKAAAASSAATAQANAATATATAPRPPAPPAPPAAPRVPGPGKGFYLFTLAWAFIAAAIIAWCAREGLLSIWPVFAWGMLFYTGLGVILLAVSLSGRRVGFLGFLGWFGALPAIILLAGHDGLLKAYSGEDAPAPVVIDLVVDEYVDEPIEDPTELFANEYASVLLGTDCRSETAAPTPYEGSSARIAIASPVTKAVAHDILAATTTVTIPQGTNLDIVSDGDAQAEVYFADKDLVCTFWGYEGTYVSLANAGEPVVTLTVRDDTTANLIILKEK